MAWKSELCVASGLFETAIPVSRRQGECLLSVCVVPPGNSAAQGLAYRKAATATTDSVRSEVWSFSNNGLVDDVDMQHRQTDNNATLNELLPFKGATLR
jgi:hypothetical protein